MHGFVVAVAHQVQVFTAMYRVVQLQTDDSKREAGQTRAFQMYTCRIFSRSMYLMPALYQRWRCRRYDPSRNLVVPSASAVDEIALPAAGSGPRRYFLFFKVSCNQPQHFFSQARPTSITPSCCLLVRAAIFCYARAFISTSLCILLRPRNCILLNSYRESTGPSCLTAAHVVHVSAVPSRCCQTPGHLSSSLVRFSLLCLPVCLLSLFPLPLLYA